MIAHSKKTFSLNWISWWPYCKIQFSDIHFLNNRFFSENTIWIFKLMDIPWFWQILTKNWNFCRKTHEKTRNVLHLQCKDVLPVMTWAAVCLIEVGPKARISQPIHETLEIIFNLRKVRSHLMYWKSSAYMVFWDFGKTTM